MGLGIPASIQRTSGRIKKSGEPLPCKVVRASCGEAQSLMKKERAASYA